MSFFGTTLGGQRWISPLALQEAEYLESILPLQVFATLTWPRDPSLLRLDLAFGAWVEALQRLEGKTLAFIRAYEPQPRRHIHAVLIAGKELDVRQADLLWRGIVAPRFEHAAKVERYQKGIGGLAYVLKSLGHRTEDIQFSPNLTAFCPSASARSYGRTSAERRQKRRIASQRLA